MHERRRRLFRRARCICGFPWPCVDAKLAKIAHQYPTVDLNVSAWEAYTAAYPQMGRAGRLTPAQASRSNGGRS